MSNPEETTRKQVINILSQVLKIQAVDIQGGARLREDLGMDSLASLELLSNLSDELDLDIELDDAMQMLTVDDACAYVERASVEQGKCAPVHA